MANTGDGVGGVDILQSTQSTNPDVLLYEQSLSGLQSFVAKSLDMYRSELSLVLYPTFVYMYLDLIKIGEEKAARAFFEKHRRSFESYHDEDLRRLSTLKERSQLSSHDLAITLRSEKYVIGMARDSFQCLVRHLQDSQSKLVLNLINQFFYVDLNDDLPRDQPKIASTIGSQLGEARSSANQTSLLYGMPKDTEFIAALNEADDEDATGEDGRPKKKKKKESAFSNAKKGKLAANPHAPPPTRIPVPLLKERELEKKRAAARELVRAVPLDANRLPSLCFFTLLNTHSALASLSVSADSTLMAAGMSDSTVRLHSLNGRKLRTMKSYNDLKHLDSTEIGVLDRIADEQSGTDSRLLLGHSGPVYSTSFSPFNSMLLSSAQDGTIRLWDLNTYTTAVSFHGHVLPVWDVDFGPTGYYFASASQDRTARLWATDQPLPLRIFAEHVSDVSCVRFHPNGNYIATGSYDRTIRLWDVLTGTCVRLLTGQHGAITSLAFSPDGRFLASGALNGSVRLWDLSNGSIVTTLLGHTDSVTSLAFSHDSGLLSSGSLDCTVRLWDSRSLLEDAKEPDFSFNTSANVGSSTAQRQVACYPTKTTSVHSVHFTYRNLLLAAGPFVP
ncbi:transcription initiation factor TFIID subunit 5-like [Sycon ciliatum]|uniref:transcription initiation factor TFIID subunit 5-like n=1 Tax=Sycon ciliatum TaxID=27933 RepID=UPI0031F66F65